MKFTVKVFFSTIIVIALAMGFGGYFLISSTFNAAIKRETSQALDESGILGFVLETISLNYPLKYDGVQDKTISEIASTLETGRYIKISDEQGGAIYSSEYFSEIESLLGFIDENTNAYKIIEHKNRYFVNTATMINSADRILYLETLKDITTVFTERSFGFAIYRNVTVLTLVLGALIMYVVSFWLTRPIRALTNVTKVMASGDYSRRAKKLSSDEFGLLTDDFNNMADSLQEKMTALKEEASSKERFVAAFSHEIKTPLTAVIGYADLMRSRKLDDEQLFLSADYVYKEGKRLEDLSLRLLDIIVLKKNELILKDTQVSSIFKLVEDTFSASRSIVTEYDDAVVRVEAALLATVIFNLTDNALKASDKNSTVEITGRALENGYQFSVKDYGRGIAGDEINKLTQAFYMVDKSRSRKSGGAGLGLTLCSEILELHGSRLDIESTHGKGTCVSFILPANVRSEGNNDE